MNSSPQEEKRKSKRLQVFSGLEFQLDHDTTYQTNLSCDISETGLSFYMPQPLEIGSQIRFHFPVKKALKFFSGLGRVAWCVQEPYADFYRIGVEFIEMDASSRTDLKAFLNELQPPQTTLLGPGDPA